MFSGSSSRNYYIKNVVLFDENSILLLPECLEASRVESVWGEVSQESPKNPEKSVKISLLIPREPLLQIPTRIPTLAATDFGFGDAVTTLTASREPPWRERCVGE